MKNFYRITDQQDPVALMVALMQKVDRFQLTQVEGVSEIKLPHPDFPALTELTLNVMMLCKSLSLISATVWRFSSNITMPFFSDANNIAVVLQGGQGCMISSGNEAINIFSREVWLFRHDDNAMIVNKSNDDLVVLIVVLKQE